MTNRLWELLTLHWSNAISEEEKAELDELLLEHPGDWLKSGLMDQLSFNRISVIDEEQTSQLIDRVTTAISETPPRKKFGFRQLALFLGIFITAAGALAGYLFWAQQPRYKIVSTDAGMKTKIRLPDGSTIWLNAGSTLKYREKWDQPKREVYLSGEGFFDIQPSAGKPFIIHAEKMDIRVLGTSFNVRSYKEEDFQETAVVSGAVEVTLKNKPDMKPIRLTLHEKVILRKTDIHDKEDKQIADKQKKEDLIIERQPLSPISPTDSSHSMETAWMNNQLIFRNETMESLALRLERWYGLKIIIENPQLATSRFSGRADNVSIEKLLTILQEIQPFNYSIQDDIVTIK
ncbi:FecR family protein [Chitinophaga arvensicola]|uniref:Ferric-dicitrate binding protein FerR, regulates iron transport through sigma-19 n=1 Tax=Chitinophaga arvensicola TaxID=29529 RepID=A0A1I0RF58_9BACT|nr:FecR domain-containing protein [Chitinophaga arvensicola]SEW39504.1 ferric-dicitrate binding protein FerR, regulates iron transport through sigma-19 [Chitinophaga arvensicola]